MALVTIDELKARLPFELDEDDSREAEGSLEDLSIDAQSIGTVAWQDEISTPQAVKNLILRAAARHMKNYEGYIESRAGDEYVQWTDRGESAGTATFTEDEKRVIRQLAGKAMFMGTVNTTAWNTRLTPRGQYVVPVSNGGEDFPLYAHEKDPW